jgi:OOP family OmpA-OmpF porin
MIRLAPLLMSIFGSLFVFSNPINHNGSVKLHGKVYDLESHVPIMVDVRVFVYYNSDIIKDDSCKAVNGEFAISLNKLGWYLVSLSADGYQETTDTLWLLTADRPLIEKEYFLPQRERTVDVARTLPGSSVVNREYTAFQRSLSDLKPESAPSACIYFPFGKCSLPETAATELAALTELLKINPTLSLNIIGYTDADGPEDYNIMLSQWRAEAVAKYLIDHGISGSRLVAHGLGKSGSVAHLQSGEEKAKNRRVELVVMQSAAGVAAVVPTNR